MLAIISETSAKPSRWNTSDASEKIIPIRAAKILGPAFTALGLIPSVLTILFENNASGLYAESSAPRNAKSTNKKAKGNTLEVSINRVNNTTVIAALKRATFSSILLFEMGQNAVVFISFVL